MIPLLAPLASQAEDTFRIAFGSCSKANLAQPLWADVLADEPDVWIWLGDIVYGDTLDMDVLRAKYALQEANPGYRRLSASAEVIGVWDDHDYGRNDAGKEYPKKRQSQQVLLDFLAEPRDSPRRTQDGVYASYDFGEGERKVKVILLDTRYHRDNPGADADILGETQWQWLEAGLRSSDARVNIVGSSIQVVPAEHRYEKWANFPAARDRLLRIVRESGAKGVIFLSGDRHQAEISRMTGGDTPYPLYDITSSGLTHVAQGNTDEPNRFRVGKAVAKLNFGLIAIDWSAVPATVSFDIRGEGNAKLLEERVALDSLE